MEAAPPNPFPIPVTEEPERMHKELGAVLAKLASNEARASIKNFSERGNADQMGNLDRLCHRAHCLLLYPPTAMGHSTGSVTSELESISRLLNQSQPIFSSARPDWNQLDRLLGDIAQRINQAERYLGSAVSELLQSAVMLGVVAMVPKLDMQEWQRLADQRLAERDAQLLALFAQTQKQLQEAGAAKDAAAKALDLASETAKHNLVTAEAQHFGEEVKRHRTAFWLWVGALAVVSLALLGYIWLVVEKQLVDLPKGSTAGDVLKYAIPRAIVFVTGYWLLLFLARGAASERHNWIVNQHRVNALRTYKTLIAATTDKAVQAAMLVQASNTIFLPQSTGFLKEEVGQSSDSPKIGDVVKVLVGNDRASSGP